MALPEHFWRDDLTRITLKPPYQVTVEATMREAIEVMVRESSGCVLICRGDVLMGIFTERDVLTKVQGPRAVLDGSIVDFMTPRPATMKRHNSLGAAVRVMHQGHYRHLPVVDEQNVPLGVLSAKSIVQYIVDHFGVAVYNLPPQSKVIKPTREGA